MAAFELNKEFISNSVDETYEIAEMLTKKLPSRAVLALHGDLGAGKTCFVQGIAMALGVKEPVTSPTFTIVNEYYGDRYLCHMDLYRLNNADEVLALGFDEYLMNDGIIAVEWSERAEELFPNDAININIVRSDDDISRRRIYIK